MHRDARCGQRSMATTYGSDDSDIDDDEKPKGRKKRMTGGQCKCGSTTQRTNHSDCPYSPKDTTISNKRKPESDNSVDDGASEDSNVIYYSESIALRVCLPPLLMIAGVLKTM